MADNKLKSLSLFFPAYNEAENIEELIQTADQIGQRYARDYEVIIIDDGSSDDTRTVVENLKPEFPNLVLHVHEKNQGYGGAVWSGFEQASKDWIFFSDADLQFDLSEIEKLILHSHDCSVIVGYRKNRRDPLIRTINAWAWKVLIRLLFGLKETRDIDCAFKLIKADAIKPILPEMVSRGAMISAEFLIRLKDSGYKIKQVGVRHYPRSAGSQTGANLKVILRAFRELWQVYRNLSSVSKATT